MPVAIPRRLQALSASLCLVLATAVAVDALQAQTAPQPPGSAPGARGFPDLVKGLQETPGCLGVEATRTRSGKNVIFAWFENKKAIMSWYQSATHKQAMDMMGMPGPSLPMKNLPEDTGPILVIASLTFDPNTPPAKDGTPSVSQIAIELYQPLPGGASSGGTFAPKGLKIPHHKSLDSEEPKTP